MIRTAAAVILHQGRGSDLRVFLAERSPKLRFLGGYHAFPGGVVDGTEREGEGSDGADAALRQCAIRELFEETGVRIGGDPGTSPEDWVAARRALLDHERSGAAGPCPAWEALRPRGAGGSLREVCRILTPPFAPVRYDTVFFLAELPAGQQPEVWPGELVSGAFVSPAEAIERWRRGELRIAPPVLILLELIAQVGLDALPEVAGGLAAGFQAGVLSPVRFSPGVIMASLRSDTIPPAQTTNTYLVGNEVVYVIDPGTPDRAEQDRLLDLLSALQDAGREIGGVLLTHHHPDHVAGLRVIATELDVEVRGHARTLDRLPEGVVAGAPIVDGERIELGKSPDGRDGWSLHAVFTPGHAQGHLCFHEDRYGALIAGDMVSTLSTIVIDPPEGHMATYLESLRRLLERDVSTLYPAHGPPAISGRRVIEHVLKHRAAREQKLLDALGADPRPADALLKRVYDDVDAEVLPLAMRSLVAGLQKLGEEGRAVEELAGWRRSGGPTT